MLDELHIKNLALIEEATFAPASSLTVITGETGSGKTALLNAVKLLVGERADSGMIREGAEELQVEGRFFFEQGSFGAALLVGEEEGALAADTVVARRVAANGRSRVSVNGSLASVRELSQGVGLTVDLCGQHEHQRLLDARHQRALLDKWGAEAVDAPLQAYRACLHELSAQEKRLQELLSLDEEHSIALDRARFALDQIDAVAPVEGEYEDLLEQLPKLEHAEMLINETASARRALAGSEGVLEQLEGAMASLDRVVKVDSSLSPAATAVRESYYELEEAARAVGSYKGAVDFSQADLEQMQDRIAELQGLMRGFGPRMEDVFSKREEAQKLLRDFSNRNEHIADARDGVAKAEASLLEAAAVLRAARETVAPRFAEAVSSQMGRLDMGSARIEAKLVDVDRAQWNDWGPHTLELMFVPGADLKPQRLGSIASGGEVSRVMLAIKVALGHVDEVDTLVFDEIDAGVGGATALSLGAVLQDLARTHQVVVVTHLPQIAVLGRAHYRVSKSGDGVPKTVLEPLTGEARVHEIARMLAGEVNETSCAHAKELLAGVE